MKRRISLLALVMAMTMLFTACGSNQTLEGKWIGKLDVTKQFEDGIKAAHPDLAEYVDFEDLVFEIDLSFDETQMSMDVEEASIEKFNENFAEGMENIAVKYWESGLAMIDLTLEEAIAESGMTEEQYMHRIYKETGIDKMVEAMSSVTFTTLDKLSQMKGTYTTPVNNELRLYYTEDTYESMEYKFKGKALNIVIRGDNFSLLIECEKQ